MKNTPICTNEEPDIIYGILFQLYKSWIEKELLSTVEDFAERYGARTLSLCYEIMEDGDLSVYFLVSETGEKLIIDPRIPLSRYPSDPNTFLFRVNIAVSIAVCANDVLYGKDSAFRTQKKALSFREELLRLAEA